MQPTTTESVPCYADCANPNSPENKTTNEKAFSWHSARIRQWYEFAAGRPIVRAAQYRRACQWLGVLVGETRMYYILATVPMVPTEPSQELHVLKEHCHLMPCRCCADHPDTKQPFVFF